MSLDYYQILGTTPNADLDTLQKAYFRRAMVDHPDRGGSHERMLVVNEAWEILSDPQSRRRYDEARTNTGSRETQEAAEADARQAHERAEHYPQRWAEFEAWLNGIAQDFRGATYGSTPLYGEIHLPIVGNSISGWVFILVGAGLGGILLSPVIYSTVMRNWGVLSNITWKIKLIAFATIVAPILGGAWLGMLLHQSISNGLKTTAKLNTSTQTDKNQETEGNTSKASEPGKSLITSCGKCGQKLRVPFSVLELMITCRKCGDKFAFQANQQK